MPVYKDTAKTSHVDALITVKLASGDSRLTKTLARRRLELKKMQTRNRE